MDIIHLEEVLNDDIDDKYVSIIQLIIDAVRDYPQELTDTDLYFNIIKQQLDSENITADLLREYININPCKHDENNIWIISSLTALLEAFQLMQIYNIAFDDVLNIISNLSRKK